MAEVDKSIVGRKEYFVKFTWREAATKGLPSLSGELYPDYYMVFVREYKKSWFSDKLKVTTKRLFAIEITKGGHDKALKLANKIINLYIEQFGGVKVEND